MISGQESLQRLRAGNQRFVQAVACRDQHLSESRRGELLAGQNPHAIVLGCSDSRVPIEFVFDQGFGDLFVIRVAGNIVQPSQIGSVEFAVERFDTRLVVVLGHSNCSAVEAALKELQQPGEPQSRGLTAIVDCIKPSVRGLLKTDLVSDSSALLHRAVRANVSASVEALNNGSEIIERLIREEGLLVVGAEYSLATGEVDFFDC